MEISYRLATYDDKSALDACLQHIIATERAMDECLQTGFIEYYDPLDFVRLDNAILIVAIDNENDGMIVGCGAAKIKQAREYYRYDEYLYLAMMYVANEYRGKGINGDIINCLIQWGKQKGVENASLTVYPDNTSAIRAYEKLGFKPALLEMRLRQRNTTDSNTKQQHEAKVKRP